MLRTTIRSYPALGLGAFFAFVTARTIFDDVWSGAPVTVAHFQAGAALVAAIASGHMAWPQLRQARIGTGLGLILIFVASTGYIVTSAGARNAELAQVKTAAILKTNEERASLKIKIAEAEADVALAKTDFETAKAAAARECGSGKKTKCEGREATRDSASRDAEKAEAFAMLQRGRLSALGPEHEANGGYKHAARVFEAMSFGKADDIERRLRVAFAIRNGLDL